jgi:hypothetical protein
VTLKVKKHLLGIFVFICTFFVGFWWAPLRFSNQGVGHGAVGTGSHCSFSIYSSTQLQQVSFWFCSFDDRFGRDQFMNRLKTAEKPISSSRDRILIEYDSPEHGYCAYRIDTHGVLIICSASFNHLNEFEQQFTARKN